MIELNLTIPVINSNLAFGNLLDMRGNRLLVGYSTQQGYHILFSMVGTDFIPILVHDGSTDGTLAHGRPLLCLRPAPALARINGALRQVLQAHPRGGGHRGGPAFGTHGQLGVPLDLASITQQILPTFPQVAFLARSKGFQSIKGTHRPLMLVMSSDLSTFPGFILRTHVNLSEQAISKPRLKGMVTDSPSDVRNNWPSALLLVALIVASAFGLRSHNIIDHDVAFLTWAADQVTGPPVFGVDILEVNPPLSILIYMPAVLLSHFAGFEWGIRIWMLFLPVLSFLAFWRTADTALRLPLGIAFVLFFTLFYPSHFGQREQIVFLLCAPYVAGSSTSRRWAVVIGIMAGVGFVMKPHFLIVPVLIAALRRKIGVEEAAIAATGIVYATIIAVFFQPYVFQMLPAVLATYGAISYAWIEVVWQSAFVFSAAALTVFADRSTTAPRPYLLAALGFTVAALLQNKGFYYHFIPAFGFLAMYLTAVLFCANRRAATAAAIFLLAQSFLLGEVATRAYREPPEWNDYKREIRAEIDNSESYISLTIIPSFPFPAAIHTPSRYLGIAMCQIFMPAVIEAVRGTFQGDAQEAKRLALNQAIRELERKPELVIVTPKDHDGSYFDVLGWLKQDEHFRMLWQDYHLVRSISSVDLYRRK